MVLFRRLSVVFGLVFLLAAAFALGYLARRGGWIPYSVTSRVRSVLSFQSGSGTAAEEEPWDRANWSHASAVQGDGADLEAMDALSALGYLDAYEPPTTSETGVTYSAPGRHFGGYRLYVSGHAPEAHLIDTRGTRVHTWSVAFEKVFPNIPPHQTYANRFRRVHAEPDGSLLAIFDLAGIVKLDRDSRVIWKHAGKSHHDFHLQPDGSVYVIDSRFEAVPKRPRALIDYVTHLSPEGEMLSTISLYECIAQSDYAALLLHAPPTNDILHTNTLHILNEADRVLLSSILGETGPDTPVALLSFREIDTIALVDLDAARVIWALTGMWRLQHEPVITERGTIMVFDNMGLGDWSRLVEIDPMTQAVVWRYEGSPERPFRTATGGAVHLLPNGNCLVIEMAAGRAFELTPEGQIAWEFRSPHRLERDGQVLVANLYDMVAYAPEQVPFAGGSSLP